MARREAKLVEKISEVQMLVLKALQEGGNLRVWQQEFHPWGRHCELRGSNDKVVRKIHMPTVESLQSEEKYGMLLEIKSKTNRETIYVISKKGLVALEKELKKDGLGQK